MPKINRYWNSDPDSLVEREPPQTYDLCKCCELVNQLVWKEKRLERALWLTRAERAKECHFMWCQLIYDKKYCIVKFNVRKEWGENVKQGQTLHTPQGWADVWDNVESKCRAKAEECK